MSVKNEFLTPLEASKYLRVSRNTVYRWVHTGEIPVMRAGKQWRFRRSDLDQWLKKEAKLSDKFSHK